MRIVVLGQSGQVATELQRRAKAANAHLTVLGREAADLSDPASAAAVLRGLIGNADAVINAAAYNAVVFDSAQTYLDHWFALVDNGLDDIADKIISTDPAARELENRALIFSRELDPVWTKIDMMVWAETSDYMITILRNQEIEQPR